jgi:type IV secretory pathway TrbL component
MVNSANMNVQLLWDTLQLHVYQFNWLKFIAKVVNTYVMGDGLIILYCFLKNYGKE